MLWLPGKKQLKEGEVCLDPRFQRKWFTVEKAWGRWQVAWTSHIQAEQESGTKVFSWFSPVFPFPLKSRARAHEMVPIQFVNAQTHPKVDITNVLGISGHFQLEDLHALLLNPPHISGKSSPAAHSLAKYKQKGIISKNGQGVTQFSFQKQTPLAFLSLLEFF